MSHAQRSARLEPPRLEPGPQSEREGRPADTGYTATGLPAGLSIDTEGRICGLIDEVGHNEVTITADEGDGNPRRLTFTWIVI